MHHLIGSKNTFIWSHVLIFFWSQCYIKKTPRIQFKKERNIIGFNSRKRVPAIPNLNWENDGKPSHLFVYSCVVTVPKPVVRDPGLLIDSHLLLKNQVNQVCKCARLATRKKGRIRPYLTQDVCERLVYAFITSKLDSCSSISSGLPSVDWAGSRCFLSPLELCMVKHHPPYISELLNI